MTIALALTEDWDTHALDIIQCEVFGPHWYKIPQHLRIRTGSVPGTKGTSRKTLGCYLPAIMHQDGIPSIYTSPLVSNDLQLLATLVHEAIHAIVPEAGHRLKPFGTIARTVGLAGRLTATVAGLELTKTLEYIAGELGPRPHATINPGMRVVQKTYMIKAECPLCYGFVRGTVKELTAMLPQCGVCGSELEWTGKESE